VPEDARLNHQAAVRGDRARRGERRGVGTPSFDPAAAVRKQAWPGRAQNPF